jgi:hypothetical protein
VIGLSGYDRGFKASMTILLEGNVTWDEHRR